MANGQNANPNGNGYSYGWNKLFRRIVKTYCAVENASIGEFEPKVIASLATITQAYLNTNYPDMTVMGKVIFTNITGQAATITIAQRITAGATGVWIINTVNKAV